MGAGKTSWAIQMMNERPQERFLYVTPYLNECDRIIEACGEERFCQPHDKAGKTKLEDLKAAMAEGRSIATTHELFKMIDREVLAHAEDHGYILILDEVIEVIKPVALDKLDPDVEDMEYSGRVQAMLDREVLVKGEARGNGLAVSLLPGPERRLGFGEIRRYAEEGRAGHGEWRHAGLAIPCRLLFPFQGSLQSDLPVQWAGTEGLLRHSRNGLFQPFGGQSRR